MRQSSFIILGFRNQFHEVISHILRQIETFDLIIGKYDWIKATWEQMEYLRNQKLRTIKLCLLPLLFTAYEPRKCDGTVKASRLHICKYLFHSEIFLERFCRLHQRYVSPVQLLHWSIDAKISLHRADQHLWHSRLVLVLFLLYLFIFH